MQGDVLIASGWDDKPLTVNELIKDIKENGYNGDNYYKIKPSSWKPDAKDMVDAYLVSEIESGKSSSSEVDSFDEVFEDIVKPEHLQMLQETLDKIFDKNALKMFFTYLDEIEIDVEKG